ncbi:protein lethal(2)denticleless isoform X1 [Neodiprion virginianus]|uniref:protein lethal(2)denticleless isoform X1 n=1 Tax=Neodiprion fabricii TaxID=2872261 RepID=UPI001ED953EE|nr:protein lethal(2)denticleless isoform X1 [Neodiprion fabricii]XP_046610220.1 protein lethal(2)denticleless isoform X1 [Neodiprion virginianus]
MNIVKSVLRREEGFGALSDYDIALRRLKCYHNDVYCGISPSLETPDFNPEPPVFACKFSTTRNNEHVLALANEDGKIALQNTTITGNFHERLEGTQAHYNAIFDVAWMPGEMKLVTASGDHTSKLWDISQEEIKQMECFQAHTRSVKTAVFRHQDKAVFATGARDGAIMIWDIRANHTHHPRPDNCIYNSHSMVSAGGTKSRKRRSQASRAHSITSLVFQDDFTLISCAAGDGIIKVWDLRKNYSSHKRDPVAKNILQYTGGGSRNGFTSLLVCPAGVVLYASCMDNIIYAYNIATCNPKPVAEFYGHQNSTFYVKSCLSPDGRYLASGSSDEFAYIWNTSKPGRPLVKLSGHTAEVTCIAWCSIGEAKIVTCSDDSRHRIWRVGLEHKGDNSEVEIQGEANPVPIEDALSHLVGGLEATPTISCQWIHCQQQTPGSDTTVGPSSGPPSSTESVESYNCSEKKALTPSTKRRYSQMTADELRFKFESVLSPVEENLEGGSAKRLHIDNRGARRLFSSANECGRTLSANYDSDEPGPSSSTVNDRSNSEVPFSPTLNLPNYVIDGTAPHLLQISPQKYKENVDWLTKIRKEKFEQKSKAGIGELTSPKATATAVRRSARSRSTEPRKTIKEPSLLNFFRVSGKECEKELCVTSDNLISSKSVPSDDAKQKIETENALS